MTQQFLAPKPNNLNPTRWTKRTDSHSCCLTSIWHMCTVSCVCMLIHIQTHKCKFKKSKGINPKKKLELLKHGCFENIRAVLQKINCGAGEMTHPLRAAVGKDLSSVTNTHIEKFLTTRSCLSLASIGTVLTCTNTYTDTYMCT